MKSPQWEDVRNIFFVDGTLREIRVLGIDMCEWQSMLDGLRASAIEFSYLRMNQCAELPMRAEDAFPLPGYADRTLKVMTCDVTFHCHFFTPKAIEFDFDPRAVSGQRELDGVINVMRCLAQWTGRQALLCFEASNIALVRTGPNDVTIEFVPRISDSGWFEQ